MVEKEKFIPEEIKKWRIPEVYNLNEGLDQVEKRIKELIEEFDRPIIVAVAGGSASGKTTKVAKELKKRFESIEGGAGILSMDDYYKGKDFMAAHPELNWDQPEALDLDQLKKDLHELKLGKTIQKPIYSMKESMPVGTESFKAPKVLILEGLFALHDILSDETDLKIFTEVGLHGRLLRRLMRDVERTGLNQKVILKYYQEIVVPMHEKYIKPSRKEAEYIIINEYDPKKETEKIKNYEVQLKVPFKFSGEKLKELGAEFVKSIHQRDVYYIPPNKEPEEVDELIRIRNEGERYFITYKGPQISKEVRIRPKIEFEIDKNMAEVLEKLGYKPFLEIKKDREIYKIKEVELVVDDVKDLGKFIEIRAKKPEEESVVKELSAKLAIDPSKEIRKTYFELIKEELEKPIGPEIFDQVKRILKTSKDRKEKYLELIKDLSMKEIEDRILKIREKIKNKPKEVVFPELSPEELGVLEKRIKELKKDKRVVEFKELTRAIEFPLLTLRIDYLLGTKKISGSRFREEALKIASFMSREILKREKLSKENTIVIAPWRAGLSIAEAFADQSFKNFWHIGARRNEKTLETEIYYEAIPKVVNQVKLEENKGLKVVITDPMLATGNTIKEIIDRLLKYQIKEENIIVNSIISAPEGIVELTESYPKIKIYTGSIDEKLDSRGFIVPGLGDFGDKYFDGITLEYIQKRWVGKKLISPSDFGFLLYRLQL